VGPKKRGKKHGASIGWTSVHRRLGKNPPRGLRALSVFAVHTIQARRAHLRRFAFREGYGGSTVALAEVEGSPSLHSPRAKTAVSIVVSDPSRGAPDRIAPVPFSEVFLRLPFRCRENLTAPIFRVDEGFENRPPNPRSAKALGFHHFFSAWFELWHIDCSKALQTK
jgi:hypothetical protein